MQTNPSPPKKKPTVFEQAIKINPLLVMQTKCTNFTLFKIQFVIPNLKLDELTHCAILTIRKYPGSYTPRWENLCLAARQNL